jgi:DNA-binding transcriptional LysR family regulator
MPRILVASPDFVEKHGPFMTPEDLTSVPWIRFSRIEDHRIFHTPGGARIKVTQTGSLTVNSIEAMVDLTCHGAGISSPPTHFVEAKIASGALTTCLPDHHMDTLPVYAIWHRTIVPNLLVKVFIDYLSRKMPDGSAAHPEKPSTSDA